MARPGDRLRRRVAERSLPALPAIDPSLLAAVSDLGSHAAGVPAGLAALAPAPSAGPSSGALPAVAALSDLPRPFAALSRSASGMVDALFSRARSQLGTRYVLGGDRPGGALDCSAFTRFAMEALGIQLPRTAAQQARVGVAVPRDESRLRPGDLLTFGTRRRVSHVGIYLGEGRFIHASVSSGRVIETTFARNGRLFRQWLGARRLVAAPDSGTARDGVASGG